ncbi:MAG: hypothetical protein ACKVQJ_05930 [Pyrinomonadaceae bacterium]
MRNFPQGWLFLPAKPQRGREDRNLEYNDNYSADAKWKGLGGKCLHPYAFFFLCIFASLRGWLFLLAKPQRGKEDRILEYNDKNFADAR